MRSLRIMEITFLILQFPKLDLCVCVCVFGPVLVHTYSVHEHARTHSRLHEAVHAAAETGTASYTCTVTV